MGVARNYTLKYRRLSIITLPIQTNIPTIYSVNNYLSGESSGQPADIEI